MPMPRHLTDLSIFTILKFFLVVVALFFLYMIKEVLALLFVALILSSAFDSWVDKLEKVKIPRWLSILVIYVILVLLIGAVVYLLIPPLVAQVGQLAQNFPEYADKITALLEKLRTFSQQQGALGSFNRGLISLQDNISGIAQSSFGTVFNIFGGIVSFFLVLVLTFYMTVEENAMKRMIVLLVPRQHQSFVLQLTNKVQGKIGAWLKGQLILCLIVGVMTYIGLTIMGVDYALTLALVAAVAEFIPYVGQITSAALAVFLAFTQSPILGLLVLVLYIIIQQLENQVIVPKVMQKAVGLNPVIILSAVLIGAKIGGVIGLLLAVPVATTINVILCEMWGNSIEEKGGTC
ncbi:MAG: AI-2E family transporter [Parcubacteria group bacterium]